MTKRIQHFVCIQKISCISIYKNLIYGEIACSVHCADVTIQKLQFMLFITEYFIEFDRIRTDCNHQATVSSLHPATSSNGGCAREPLFQLSRRGGEDFKVLEFHRCIS